MKFRLVVFIIIISLTKFTIAQNSSIKGKVIDEKTRETLPGAVVVVKGTTTGR